MKKTLEDIIILKMFTINDSHDIWFFRYGVQQTNLENQNFEKLKKAPGAIIILPKVYQKS